MREIEREKILLEAQQHTHIGSWVWDVINGNTFWSDEMFGILGYTKNEIVPTYDITTNHVFPEDVELFQNKVENAIDKKKTFDFEYRLVRKDGKMLYVISRGKGYFNKQDQLVRISGSIEDITDRKIAEIELNKSHKRLRELAMYMQEAIENERMKIALDLHDDLGQQLTALNMEMSWLKARIIKDSPYLSDKMDEMTDILKLVMKNVQVIATELRPSVLDNLGLISAIEWHLKEYEKKFRIKCQLNVSPKGMVIKQSLSVAIFRIMQEALTNVARHANASLVKVNIAKAENLLKIIIADNGMGITKDNIENSRSFGLMGIKERANVFKGKVKIIGEPNKGTKLIVKIPYEK